jgi:hypothetical protein
MGWTVRGLGFDSLQRQRLFCSVQRPGLLWALLVLMSSVYRVERLGREADHLHPSTTGVKDRWSYTSTIPHVFVVCCLIKHGDAFPSRELDGQIQTVNINPVLGRLHGVDLGNVANVSEVYTPSFLRVELWRMGEMLCIYIGLYFEKTLGGKWRLVPSSGQ